MSKKPLLLSIVQEHVGEVFEKSTQQLLYHNINHTKDVVNSALELGDRHHLSGANLEILLIAAWFHDIGYLENIKNHEQHSANTAALFLKKNNFPTKSINKVEQCILATKLDAKPTTILEKILVDADLYGLSTENHFKNAALLRQEFSLLNNKVIDDVEWLKTEITFLSNHHYHTNYAIEHLEPIKQQHLKQRIAELETLMKL